MPRVPAVLPVLAALLLLPACGRDAPAGPSLPDGPQWVKSAEFYGCDWVNDPTCKPRFPTAQEMQAIQSAIAKVTCTDLRYWLEANVSNITVYSGYNGEWGDYHFGSGSVHLWDRTFAYAGELVKTLIHEASHALYTSELAAQAAETRCGG